MSGGAWSADLRRIASELEDNLGEVHDTDDSAMALRCAADRLEQLDSALRLAFTALERSRPDQHDASWVRDVVLPTLRRALR